MAFTNRHAPEDTAIKQEALTENIDVRGLGRYYPEEYSGPIHAAQNRGQILADVPKTLAGIVLNHNDHAMSTWQAEQEIQLQDKKFVNRLLLENRQQQMELATDIELFDARKDLENQIFQARKKVALEGGMNSEAAINEVIENFKDRFQGRLIPDRKWQSILNELGLRSAAQARAEDVKTGILTTQFAIQDQFNSIYHSIIGMQQNPDGTFQPMMDIKTGMDLFVKNISPLIQQIDAQDRPQLLQQCFNAMVQGQAKALVELYQKGQLSADTLMTQLEGLRETYGGITNSWTFTDENGNPLKDTDNKDLTIDLTLDSSTELFLIQAFRDAKGGIGNGGEQIADTTLSDFKNALGYDDIEKQGWSKDLLTLNTGSLEDLLTNSVANVVNSTASDSKKLTTIRDLMKIANDAYMLLYAKQLVNDLGPDALEGMRQLNRDIEDAYAHNRRNISWSDFKAPIVVKGKTYYPEPSMMTDNLKLKLSNIGIDMNLIAPKLGDSDEEAAQYWKSFSGILNKYIDAMSNNDMSDLLYTTDGTVRGSIDNIVSYFTSDQLFDLNKDEPILKDTSEISKNLKANLQLIKETNKRNGSSRYIPTTAIDSILGNINKMPTTAEQIEAKKFLIATLNDTDMLSDIYAYSKECSRQQKDDGGLLSLDALLNSKEGYDAYKTAINNNIFKTGLKANDQTDIENRARLIRTDLNIPMQDWNAYEKLEQWCMLAAYDPATKEIDTHLFEKYYREALNNQYTDLKSNLFTEKSIYKNHPAITPYKYNMNRFYNIDKCFKQNLNKYSSNLGYLQDTLKDISILPDMNGTLYFVDRNGNKVGQIYDDPSLYTSNSIQEIMDVSFGILGSRYAAGRYEDYLSDFKEKQKNEAAQIAMHSSRGAITENYNYAKEKPLTEDQYIKRHIARLRLGQNPKNVVLSIQNYNLRKNNNEGALKNIDTLIDYNDIYDMTTKFTKEEINSQIK